MILGCGGLSFGMFSDISGLYTLDDRSFPFPAWQPQMFPDTATCSLQGKKPLPCLPSWEPLLWSNHGCKQAGGLQAEAGPQGRVTVKKKKKPVTGQMFQAFWVLLCFVFVWNHIPGWVGEQGFSTVLDAHSPVPGLCPPGLCGTYLIRCLIKLLWSEFCLKCILGMHY